MPQGPARKASRAHSNKKVKRLSKLAVKSELPAI